MKNKNSFVVLLLLFVLAVGISGLAWTLISGGGNLGDLVEPKEEITCYVPVVNNIGFSARFDGIPNCERSGKCKSLFSIGSPLSLVSDKLRLHFDTGNLLEKENIDFTLMEGTGKTVKITTCTNSGSGKLILEEIDEKIGLDSYTFTDSVNVYW